MAAHRRLFLSTRRHADRRLLAIGEIAEGCVGAGSGRAALPSARLTLQRQSAQNGLIAASSERRARNGTSGNPLFDRAIYRQERPIMRTISILAAAFIGASVASSSAFAQGADRKFIKDAIEGNLAEIQMGQLAQK